MSREAMQIALDALEANLGNWAAKTKAVEVLRQTLVDADDTSQERVDETVKTEHDRAVELGKAYERGWNAALAQQEPVAFASSLDFDDDDQEIIPAKDKGKLGTSNCDIALYTAPPKHDYVIDCPRCGHCCAERTWVGLTDDEVSDVIDDVLEGGGWLDVARALEAAIKRKNT